MFIPNPHPALAELTANGQAKVDFLAWFNDGFVITDTHVLAGRPDIITIDMLPESIHQSPIVPRQVVLHTQASGRIVPNVQAVAYWRRPDVNTEAHIAGPEMTGGKITQAMPFNIRADSQGAGWRENGILQGGISIETQDLGGPTINTTPWTLEQLNVLAGICTALCATYGIFCTDTTSPTTSGISPHNRWPQWSSAAHSCPGAARTRQMDWVRGEVAKRLGSYYPAVGMACPS